MVELELREGKREREREQEKKEKDYEKLKVDRLGRLVLSQRTQETIETHVFFLNQGTIENSAVRSLWPSAFCFVKD